ncbi:potassium voltage-gated channel subfamily E member 2-like [Hyla sarda]|uniref:potassium voltage-gated channel subfamily E member 2-like n=1 Tax=Hyla sarda TaxID=327740 RepID=UPI0024C26DBC|nr:potassium voltage-gated channel subfamily E member 2-like [Hyla sarda]
MESLRINTTLLNKILSFLSEGQCTGCNRSTSVVSAQDEDPVRLAYILILMCAFAFFTLVIMYWKIYSRQPGNSTDPYHTYIIGTWKMEQKLLDTQKDTSLTIENKAVTFSNTGAEAETP